jgi:hypothetical protein
MKQAVDRPRRHLVEATRSIDIRSLKRTGQVASGERFVMICYPGEAINGKVRLVHLLRPVFGGVRTYFCCPVCDRRCDLLYVRSELACRRCHRLAFTSENETVASRALRRCVKRREQLGQAGGGVVPPFPCKPKWARWTRYLHLRTEAMKQECEYWRNLAARIGLQARDRRQPTSDGTPAR